MQKCPKCDGRLGRAHRKALEKLMYSDVFSCDKCKIRVGWYHPLVLPRAGTLSACVPRAVIL